MGLKIGIFELLFIISNIAMSCTNLTFNTITLCVDLSNNLTMAKLEISSKMELLPLLTFALLVSILFLFWKYGD